ncbi:MAG TPA: TetR/AcrR family transcriptional regulator [Acidimicrobiales bacterium]|jgi:AcrR family transcriptional regulator|nr:TetR/AcrR family transcriptional regulator [Acidimicrobiales bacterium]
MELGEASGEAALPAGRRERKKAETKQKIVDAASALFWSKGYDATSIQDIAEAADFAPGTLYLHFESKADIALVQFHQWMSDFIAAIEARPDDEPPDQMLAATLFALSDAGYTSSQRLRDETGRALPSVVMGILFTETSLELAGRIYQIMIETEQALAGLFTRRMGYADGSLEPQIIASAFVAAWRVAVYGFANMVEAGVDPPAPDQIGTRAFTAYTEGLDRLWTQRPKAEQS